MAGHVRGRIVIKTGDLRLRLELVRLRVRRLQRRQDHVHHVMLFGGLVEHVLRIRFLRAAALNAG